MPNTRLWGVFPTFRGAFQEAETLPKHEGVEIAMIGRSNVGKSSLLNALFNTKKLARGSQTPGCTKALMLFEVHPQFYVMDLPGYGFNKQPKHVQKTWVKAINGYLAYRRELVHVYLLLDSRRGITENDQQMINYLNHYAIPHSVVLTKTDKISAKELSMTEKKLTPMLQKKSTCPHYYLTSSENKEGIANLQSAIEGFLASSAQ